MEKYTFILPNLFNISPISPNLGSTVTCLMLGKVQSQDLAAYQVAAGRVFRLITVTW